MPCTVIQKYFILFVAVEVSTSLRPVFTCFFLIKTCIYMFLVLCKYSLAVLFTLPPFYFTFYFNFWCIYCLLSTIFLRIFQNSYYRSSGHVVSEYKISFGNNHFRGELVHLFTFTGIIIAKLWFYCATIAYHVGLNALLVAARNCDQRLRKKDIYSWP